MQKDGFRPGEPQYDPRTLYVPKKSWQEFTPFEKQVTQLCVCTVEYGTESTPIMVSLVLGGELPLVGDAASWIHTSIDQAKSLRYRCVVC